MTNDTGDSLLAQTIGAQKSFLLSAVREGYFGSQTLDSVIIQEKLFQRHKKDTLWPAAGVDRWSTGLCYCSWASLTDGKQRKIASCSHCDKHLFLLSFAGLINLLNMGFFSLEKLHLLQIHRTKPHPNVCSWGLPTKGYIFVRSPAKFKI